MNPLSTFWNAGCGDSGFTIRPESNVLYHAIGSLFSPMIISTLATAERIAPRCQCATGKRSRRFCDEGRRFQAMAAPVFFFSLSSCNRTLPASSASNV